MNLLKEVLKHEVYPALGCTEPISIAYAASVAASGISEPIERLRIVVDVGTYKNGLAVKVPNTNGEHGNLIAGILGALVAKPDLKMEILRDVTSDLIGQANEIISNRLATIEVDSSQKDIYIRVELTTSSHSSVCIIARSHTEIYYHELDGTIIIDRSGEISAIKRLPYQNELEEKSVSDLVDIAMRIDDHDYAYLYEGVHMNLAMAEAGKRLRKVGWYLLDLQKNNYLADDVFSSSKILTACASDARMEGIALPVMSSGESGNQGIVAILVPYNVGNYFKIDEKRIIESIALSHLLNSYVKLFTGSLSPLCGCAIAAGVGATAAIVYQQNGKDLKGITLAIDNVVSDIGGMFCDGAKSGCAFKVVSSTEAAIRAAYMGINHYGLHELEGFIGHTVEETIRNLGKLTVIGMAQLDTTMIDIMLNKSARKISINSVKEE